MPVAAAVLNGVRARASAPRRRRRSRPWRPPTVRMWPPRARRGGRPAAPGRAALGRRVPAPARRRHGPARHGAAAAGPPAASTCCRGGLAEALAAAGLHGTAARDRGRGRAPARGLLRRRRRRQDDRLGRPEPRAGARRRANGRRDDRPCAAARHPPWVWRGSPTSRIRCPRGMAQRTAASSGRCSSTPRRRSTDWWPARRRVPRRGSASSPTASTSTSREPWRLPRTMAVERLHELVDQGSYDVIVLDTPPLSERARLPRRPRADHAIYRGQALRLLLRPRCPARTSGGA